jgi:hypothetical protein
MVKHQSRAKHENHRIRRPKYWEIIADNFSKLGEAGGGLACVDCDGRTIRVANAKSRDRKHLSVHAHQTLKALASTSLNDDAAARGPKSASHSVIFSCEG